MPLKINSLKLVILVLGCVLANHLEAEYPGDVLLCWPCVESFGEGLYEDVGEGAAEVGAVHVGLFLFRDVHFLATPAEYLASRGEGDVLNKLMELGNRVGLEGRGLL